MNLNHFAIAVGIDIYPGMPTRPLQYCKNDAGAFFDWVTSPDGGGVPPKENALLVTASSVEEEQGVKRPLRTEVVEFLADLHRRVDDDRNPLAYEGSRLYIYLSGHGVAPDNGRGALLFADASPIYYWGDMMDLDNFARYYERCQLFEEVVLIGDFCRDIDKAVPAVSEPRFGKCFSSPHHQTRRLVAYASGIGHKAAEPDGLDEASDLLSGPHRSAKAFFTRALLEGLSGKATPHPVTGVIDPGRLESYVRRRVAELARDFPQVVDIQPSTTQFVLKRHEVVRRRVEITIPEACDQEVSVILESEDLTMETWSPLTADTRQWQIELPPANYAVRSASTSLTIEDFKVRLPAVGSTGDVLHVVL